MDRILYLSSNLTSQIILSKKVHITCNINIDETSDMGATLVNYQLGQK